VPLFLARHQPGVRVASVAFLEVQDGVLDPTDYAAGFSAPVLPFDYVWFTPRADDQDHCAKLKKNWSPPKDTKTDATEAPAAPPSPAERPAPAKS
jgi:hypothetical protein